LGAFNVDAPSFNRPVLLSWSLLMPGQVPS
jgi:hypothetical protein